MNEDKLKGRVRAQMLLTIKTSLGMLSGVQQHWHLSPYKYQATSLPFALGTDTLLVS